MRSKKAIVIGAGIVGLAMARSLAMRGYSVTVFERDARCVGASIRNFGMVWPIGQPDGVLYERALLSKKIWKSLANEGGFWYEEKGSLHVAHSDAEWQVLQEFAAMQPHRPLELLEGHGVLKKCEAINPHQLKGALYSADEMIVESREIIQQLPQLLHEKYDVQFHFGKAITAIEHPAVFCGKERWEADLIIVCSGVDFETLYSEVFATAPFTKCKLQMMRLAAQPDGFRIGPALCGGLSLIHYKSFACAPSLQKLHELFQNLMPDYIHWGIHVMMSQNANGELTIGDSHEYAPVHTPFDKTSINDLILDYLKKFAQLKDWTVVQQWNGTYAKLTDGASHFHHQPEPGVHIVNGLGGNGMTLSFGLAEELMEKL